MALGMTEMGPGDAFSGNGYPSEGLAERPASAFLVRFLPISP